MFISIFFNSHLDLRSLATELFAAIGIGKDFVEGDSVHVLDGFYFSSSVFGVKIKLEGNSYDYDDEYKYMLGIREDFLSDFKPDDKIVEDVAEIIIKLLLKNLKIIIARELGEGNLEVYSPGTN